MKPTFTAIDFETATRSRVSICQLGLVRVEEGKVIEKISQLVQPPDNYFEYPNIRIHGISPEDTEGSPTFDQIWKGIRKYIHKQTVVAHNAAFDITCLMQTLTYYEIPIPKFQQQCTYRLYGKNLATLCQEHKITLTHHDALSDALACCKLYQKYLKQQKQIL